MPKNENDKNIQRIIDEEVAELKYIASIYSININRALRITKKSKHIENQLGDTAEELAFMHDCARAGIVFLHATLETTLREIVKVKLKNGGDVSHISLVSSSSSGNPNRKEKFTMSDLLNHRGKTVNAVVEESIDEYLSKKSFSNVKEISDEINRIGIRLDNISKSCFPDLSQMMDRRHKIVHEGDLINDVMPHQLNPIDLTTVLKWINALNEFCNGMMNLIKEDTFVPKIMDRLKRENIPANRQDVSNAIIIENSTKFS